MRDSGVDMLCPAYRERQESPWPEWLGSFAVADEAFASAYDSLLPEQRAMLKLAIARAATLWPHDPALGEYTMSARKDGPIHQYRAPAEWAFVCWNAEYASAPGILAALMPAILAGVPSIYACGLGGDIAPAVLTALELAGQERVAVMPPERGAALLEYLASQNQRGRCVFLGDVPAAMHETARLARIPAVSLPARVRIALDASLSHDEVSETVRFLYPDTAIIPAEKESRYDAIVTLPERVGQWMNNAPLVLAPGQESCWVWPELSPVFFHATGYGFASLP